MAQKPKTSSKKTAAKKTGAKKAAAKKAPVKKSVKKVVAKKKTNQKAAPKKKTVSKVAVKKTAPKKIPAKKSVAKKSSAKKAPPKKSLAKKVAGKKVAVKKVAVKKVATKKIAAKAAPKKTPAKAATAKVVAKAKQATPKVVAAKAKPVPAKKTLPSKPLMVKQASVEAKAPAKSKAVEAPLPKLAKRGVAVARLSEKDRTQHPRTTILHPDLDEVMMEASSDSKRAIEGIGFMGIPPYHPGSKEEYMSEKQREHFRQILNLWKRVLMEEVDRTVHHMQDDAANFPDPNDRATQEEEFSLELRTRDRERKLIKKIEESLVRLEEDDYGFCEMCGIEIGIRRLEARPTATLCIDCKTMDEIRERQGN